MIKYPALLSNHKDKLITRLIEIIKRELPLPFFLSRNNNLVEGVTEYITGGKLVRAALFLFSFHAFSPSNDISSETINVAAGLELIHSGLLIHDDIMDTDDTRRGFPSMHCQFATVGRSLKVRNPDHFGISAAICLADMLFFYGGKLIQEASHNRAMITRMIGDEFTLVGSGQLADLYFTSDQPLTGDEILSIYRLKTGRYTIGLPLSLGAILSDVSALTVRTLLNLGMACGLAYQLRDDLLEILSNRSVTGKPGFSDIREGKKTFLWHLLMKKVDPSYAHILSQLLAGGSLNESDQKFILSLIKTSGTEKELITRINTLTEKSLGLAEKLPIATTQKLVLREFVQWCSTRTN